LRISNRVQPGFLALDTGNTLARGLDQRYRKRARINNKLPLRVCWYLMISPVEVECFQRAPNSGEHIIGLDHSLVDVPRVRRAIAMLNLIIRESFRDQTLISPGHTPPAHRRAATIQRPPACWLWHAIGEISSHLKHGSPRPKLC
jgi:hypothetical protein